jgi:hypothetical protein
MPASSPLQNRLAMASLVGLILAAGAILAGLTWSAIVRPEHVWSERQAREFIAARDALHVLGEHEGAHHNATRGPAPEPAPAELEAARQRFAKIEGELQRARTLQKHVAPRLIVVGGIAAVICTLIYLRCRSSA